MLHPVTENQRHIWIPGNKLTIPDFGRCSTFEKSEIGAKMNFNNINNYKINSSRMGSFKKNLGLF